MTAANDINLREEKAEDYRKVEEVTREAFWNHYSEGCDEHYLVHVMRGSASFVKELAIVAEAEGKIVGNIMYTRAKILGDDGNVYPVLCFGPVSVLPSCQGKGIGTMLIEHSCSKSRKLGYKAVLIYGDPEIYKRAGFVPAERFGICTPDGMYAAALQARELVKGALEGCEGSFAEDSVFEIDEKASAEFDKSFPHREKVSGLPSQKRFREVAAMRRPRQA